MKRRFRTYARDGWEIVQVPRVKDDWHPQRDMRYRYCGNSDRNVQHYAEIVKWCEERMDYTQFASTLHATSGTGFAGMKRFAFKNKKHATMFRLKWA